MTYGGSFKKNVVNEKNTMVNNLGTASAFHHPNIWYVLLTTLNKNRVEVSVSSNILVISVSFRKLIREKEKKILSTLKKNKKYEI